MIFLTPVVVALVAIAALAKPADATASCMTWSDRYQQDIDGVCVCTASDCDSVYNGHLFLQSGEVGVFQTSKSGHRLDFSTTSLSSNSTEGADITIDTATTYKSINGFAAPSRTRLPLTSTC
jgi:glucosylceramidase